jgi:hypothetical protein
MGSTLILEDSWTYVNNIYMRFDITTLRQLQKKYPVRTKVNKAHTGHF